MRWAITVVAAVTGFMVEWVSWDGGTTTRWGAHVPVAVFVGADLLAIAAAVMAWRRPRLGQAIAVSLSLALAVSMPEWQPFTATVISCFVMGRLGSPRQALVGLGVSIVAIMTTQWSTLVRMKEFDPFFGGLGYVLWLGVLVGPWAVGRMINRASARMVSLERSLEEAERAARLAERRIVARDLHDIVAHSLAGILLQASGARALTVAAGPPAGSTQERVSTALGHIESAAHQALRELHRLLDALQAAEATDLHDAGERLGGLAHLDDLIDPTRANGIDVQVRETGQPRPLDRSVDLAVYRCIQEGLANVMKHAGPGAQVRISIDWGSELAVDVLSSGGNSGAAPAARLRVSGGHGLAGLTERLASVGGTFEATQEVEGFRLRARIPLAKS
ncbi:MAG: histidine kinase [Propioniciclava sp.]|uniref:sensor histidine kinase n=1 Tax=Propioniciclava sp. TaxID=2038686 RepID=UPI0039E6DD10